MLAVGMMGAGTGAVATVGAGGIGAMMGSDTGAAAAVGAAEVDTGTEVDDAVSFVLVLVLVIIIGVYSGKSVAGFCVMDFKG